MQTRQAKKLSRYLAAGFRFDHLPEAVQLAYEDMNPERVVPPDRRQGLTT
jgi:hypothetical protein